MTEQQPPTVCQHGSLQRACLVCEVTAERDTALQLVSEMRHAEDILHRTLDTVCAERDAAVAALTEARRVLREVRAVLPAAGIPDYDDTIVRYTEAEWDALVIATAHVDAVLAREEPHG